uniref:Uncharacterized protein n=1 Tax=Ditylenchus dipsaci TaxID=166011 RepID=A0A915EMX4_9BILA
MLIYMKTQVLVNISTLPYHIYMIGNPNPDDQIHCFKPDGPVPSGRFKLQQAREDKELAELIEEIDLEQQEENVENDSNVSLECY